jgi:hypothetical protein
LILAVLGWTEPGSAALTDAEEPGNGVVDGGPSSSSGQPRFDLGACYFQAAQPPAALASGQPGWPGSYGPLRVEGGCNVTRTPVGAIGLRGSLATLQPLSQADAQGIVSTFGAQRLFNLPLGPTAARGEAAVQYTHLDLGPTGFGEVYSLESGLFTNAGQRLELGLRYRGNYAESQFADPAATPPAGWLHQVYAVTNWRAPVRHGVLTVGASAGYLVDRVANTNQNGGWQVALSAHYPVSPSVQLVAGSGYNDREYRPYVTRDVLLIDRPENTWSCNVGLSYAASARTSMQLEWFASTPASNLKALSYESGNLLFSVSTSY